MLSRIQQHTQPTAPPRQSQPRMSVVLKSRNSGVQNRVARWSAEGTGSKVRGPGTQPLLCNLENVTSLPLGSDGKKAELNGSLNPAGTFYSSKIKFGFHKAAHLGRRTGLTNQRRVLLWPFPSLSPAFNPSLFSIRKQVLNFYCVLGPVRCSGLNCVPGHHPGIHRL